MFFNTHEKNQEGLPSWWRNQMQFETRLDISAHMPTQWAWSWLCHMANCMDEWAEIQNCASNRIWLHHKIDQIFLAHVEKQGKAWVMRLGTATLNALWYWILRHHHLGHSGQNSAPGTALLKGPQVATAHGELIKSRPLRYVSSVLLRPFRQSGTLCLYC